MALRGRPGDRGPRPQAETAAARRRLRPRCDIAGRADPDEHTCYVWAVSHEEPDLEVPEPSKLEPALKQAGNRLSGGAWPAGDPELRGTINWQVIIAGLIVAAIMGSAYPYMVLKLGFGPNVSVVAE